MYSIDVQEESNLRVPVYLSIKDDIILIFAQLAQEGQSQQMAVCLGEQDGRSSVEGQPQQMAVCLVEQDSRSSVI